MKIVIFKRQLMEKGQFEMKKIVCFLLIPLIVFSFSSFIFASDYYPENPSAGDVVGDILILRPVGLIGTVIEAVAFVVSLPVTLSLSRDEEAYDFLIRDPYAFTFRRPLGKI
jgi:hypothetical protein